MKTQRDDKLVVFQKNFALGILIVILTLFVLAGCDQNTRYLISFEVDDVPVRYQIVNKNGKVSAPALRPTKTGYSFSCWSQNGSTAFNFDSKITSDLTLIALWEPLSICTVTFSYEDDATEDYTVQVYEGEQVTAPAEPSREGFEFEGWVQEDGTEFDFSSKITADLDLKALWKPLKKCTVSFSLEDGSIEPITVQVYEGEQVTAPAEPSRGIEYIFQGWYDSNNEEFDFSSPILEDITLKAVWKVRPKWRVNFYEITTTETPYAWVDVYDGNIISKPQINPTRTGYSFSGWWYNGQPYDFSKPVTSNLKLVAKWNYKDKFTITYFLYQQEDGTWLTQTTPAYKTDPLVRPDDPVRYGYKFLTWFWDSAVEEEYREVNFNTVKVYGNYKIYAQWEKKTKYTVTFVYDNGDADSTLTVYDGTIIQQPNDPVKDKYYFISWTTVDGTVKEFDFDEPITSNVTITAQWARDKIYDITFDHNNGTDDEVIRLGKDSDYKVPKPEDPTREGLDFDCWTLNGEEFDFDTIVNTDITLVAKWKLKETYNIHDTGPGGGYVFYDCDEDNDSGNKDGLKSSECGWRYLEVAKSHIGYYKFGYYRPYGTNTKVGTQTEVGTGKSNTQKLVEIMGDETYMEREGDEKASYAAIACYKKDLFNNGYDDWFLPSKDELDLIYYNLKFRWNVDWGFNYIYSSSENDADYAWSKDFFFGYHEAYQRSQKRAILPVRAF